MNVLPLNTEMLFTAEATLDEGRTVGNKRIVYVTGDSFEGPRLRGTIQPGGGDWLTVRPDGSMMMDVRSILETDDGQLIYTYYPGRLVLRSDMFSMERAAWASVDPASYYFRTAAQYETGSEKYAWLNNIIAVGVGRMTADGVGYSVYEVK